MVSKSHHILVIDIGTTATKAVIFDSKGTPIAIIRKNYPVPTPEPDWAEQDPEIVLKGVLEAIKEAYQNRPVGVDIDAISFSSQMYSIIALSPNGRPLSNSLIGPIGEVPRPLKRSNNFHRQKKFLMNS
jgi:gluconokinase